MYRECSVWTKEALEEKRLIDVFNSVKGCHVEEGFDLCCPQRMEIGSMSKRSTDIIFYVYVLWQCGS